MPGFTMSPGMSTMPGLETANTVMVTSLAPAVPQDPYKTYVVGALKTG